MRHAVMADLGSLLSFFFSLARNSCPFLLLNKHISIDCVESASFMCYWPLFVCVFCVCAV